MGDERSIYYKVYENTTIYAALFDHTDSRHGNEKHILQKIKSLSLSFVTSVVGRKCICALYHIQNILIFRGASDEKNQYNLFCIHWSFEYFSFNNFFKKKTTIFSRITVKKFFWVHDLFWGNGTTNFFFWGGRGGNWAPNTVFPSKNTIPSDLNPKNWFWGHISHISVVLLGRLFPKTIEFTFVVERLCFFWPISIFNSFAGEMYFKSTSNQTKNFSVGNGVASFFFFFFF